MRTKIVGGTLFTTDGDLTETRFIPARCPMHRAANEFVCFCHTDCALLEFEQRADKLLVHLHCASPEVIYELESVE